MFVIVTFGDQMCGRGTNLRSATTCRRDSEAKESDEREEEEEELSLSSMQITNENTTFGFAMAAGKLRGVRKFPLPVYICFPQQTTRTIADICPRLRLGFSSDGIRKLVRLLLRPGVGDGVL